MNRRPGVELGDPHAQHLHADDQHQQQDLAIEARLAQIAAYPAVDAEVDKGREGPDFFRLDRAAVQTRDNGHPEKEGQAQIFVVQHRGQRQHRAPEQSRPWAQQDAQDDDGFKTDVGGVEVGDDEADPYAQRQRNTEEGQQANGLRGGAALRK